MPVAIKRSSMKYSSTVMKETNKESVEAEDVNGTEFLLPIYNVFVFRKEIPIVLFYFAHGMTWALNYLGVSDVLRFVENLDNANYEDNLYFQVSTKCYVEVNKAIFLKYQYVQSIVGGIIHTTTNRFTIEDMYNPDIWIKKLSNNNTLEKGRDVLVFFTRMLDESTKKVLLLEQHNKEDIYSICRWIMLNYNELRMKDNLSLDNKRLRCNEYIASLLTAEFSKRLNKIITLGSKATMQDFLDTFKFSGDILLQQMYTSGILRFDDTINDLDFFSRFRYTTKGPNSLGGKNSNNISARYRGRMNASVQSDLYFKPLELLGSQQS